MDIKNILSNEFCNLIASTFEDESLMSYFHNGDKIFEIKKFNSPLNAIFYHFFPIVRPFTPLGSNETWSYGLTPEYRVPINGHTYFIDFSLTRNDQLGKKRNEEIALIEIDGFTYHDRNREQFNYERERQNNLMSLGLPIYRFTHEDIIRNLRGTIEEFCVNISNSLTQKEYELACISEYGKVI